jgi:Domain of unknown function (DUF4440)
MKAIATSDLLWRRRSRQLRAAAVTITAMALSCGASLVGVGLFAHLEAQEPGSDDRVAAKVLSLEQLWNQAEVEKDIHSLDQLLASTFIFVDVDGSLRNKPEFLSSVTDRTERIESIRSESMLSRVHGDAVIVTGVYHEKGTLNGKPYYHHGRFTDTWIKDGSAWLCASSQSTLMK